MSRHIIAIDPGPTHSAWVQFHFDDIVHAEYGPNEDLLQYIGSRGRGGTLVIEQIASYGMPVGAEVFETCVWTGRFWQAHPGPVERIKRKEICVHLCGSARAKDANVRQAIIDRFGGKDKAIGCKAKPGPLYGISGDMWSALAVALVWRDRQRVVEASR